MANKYILNPDGTIQKYNADNLGLDAPIDLVPDDGSSPDTPADDHIKRITNKKSGDIGRFEFNSSA